MVNEEILPERDSMHYAKANTLNLQADEYGIMLRIMYLKNVKFLLRMEFNTH